MPHLQNLIMVRAGRLRKHVSHCKNLLGGTRLLMLYRHMRHLQNLTLVRASMLHRRVPHLQNLIIVHTLAGSWLEECPGGRLSCLSRDDGAIRLVDPLPLPLQSHIAQQQNGGNAQPLGSSIALRTACFLMTISSEFLFPWCTKIQTHTHTHWLFVTCPKPPIKPLVAVPFGRGSISARQQKSRCAGQELDVVFSLYHPVIKLCMYIRQN